MEQNKGAEKALHRHQSKEEEIDQIVAGPIKGYGNGALNKISDIEANEKYSIAKSHISSLPVMIFNQIKAVIAKRSHQYKRNLKGLILEIFVPVIIVLVGLGLTRVQFFKNSDPRVHSIDLFPKTQNVLYNTNLLAPLKNQNPSTRELFDKLKIKDQINLLPQD